MENKTGGITFTGLLTCIFVGLKLSKIINWSWWWVLSPLYLPILISLVIFLVCALILGVFELIISILDGEDD